MSNVAENHSAPPQSMPAGSDDEAAERFLRGELGQLLGLSAQDLRIGLTVARNLLTRGAYPEALRVYVGLVLCEPANVDHQIGLANCAGLMEQHAVALQAASAVIALAPRNPRGYLLSGRSCIGLGAFDEAREDLGEALSRAKAEGDSVAAAEARGLLDLIAAAGR